jgi:RNA polymerase sigma factor (sigma-70 family)
MHVHHGIEALMVECLPMVRRMAWRVSRMLPPGVLIDDLVGEGMVAAVECSRRFDPSLSGKFSTFVWRRIQGAMWDYVTQQCKWITLAVLAEEDVAGNAVASFDDGIAEDYRLARELAEHIERLPRRPHMVATTMYQGKDLGEVADHFAVSMGTVRRWKQEALTQLQRQMCAA